MSAFGLSETIVRNQLDLSEKFNKIKVYFKFNSFQQTDKSLIYLLKEWTNDDKTKQDSELWTQWLKKYIQRIYGDSNDSASDEIPRKKRIELMNSTNPR